MLVIKTKKELYFVNGFEIKKVKYFEVNSTFPDNSIREIALWKDSFKETNWFHMEYNVKLPTNRRDLSHDLDWNIKIIDLFEKHQNDSFKTAINQSFYLEQSDVKQAKLNTIKINGNTFAYCLSRVLLLNFIKELLPKGYRLLEEPVQESNYIIHKIKFVNGQCVFVRRKV